MNKYSVYSLTNDVFLFLGEGCVIGDFHIYPRIILISDGRPTDFTETNTSDDCPQNETENVILSVFLPLSVPQLKIYCTLLTTHLLWIIYVLPRTRTNYFSWPLILDVVTRYFAYLWEEIQIWYCIFIDTKECFILFLDNFWLKTPSMISSNTSKISSFNIYDCNTSTTV